MANGDFVEVRQLAEDRQVVEVEVVAGVDAEAERVRQPGGRGAGFERTAAGAARRGVPCWVPMIQPTSTPKNTPAIPTISASLDTADPGS